MDITNGDRKVNLFENIALNFSGGGFRAASFTLGILSYLDQFQFKGDSLRTHVKGLSTVSGGTICGAAYAVSSAKGESFETFFTKFYELLQGDHFLRAALSKMEQEDVWKATYKRQSLVNAFSLAYMDKLTEADLQLLMDENPSHLEDVCFNTTEFSFGMAFRFQLGGDFGNYQLRSKELNQMRGQFKVADAIASSSCFPMGFAPMIMPDDYLAPDSDAYKALKEKKYFNAGIGIMDGGIVDNQGIGSTMLADKRRKENGYDLVLGCDVASYMMEPWQPIADETTSKLTLKSLLGKIGRWFKGSVWKWLILALGLGLTYLGVEDMFPRWTQLLLFGGGAISILGGLLFLISFGMGWLTKASVWLFKYFVVKWVPPFFLKQLTFLDDLKLSIFKRMLEERLSSSFTMINEIFLKQIRRLNYNLFYESETLDHRRALVLIYQLTEGQFKNKMSTEIDGVLKTLEIKPPNQKIFDVAQVAFEMGTTLWFTPEDEKKNRLDNLIACGQFSVCYSLIDYLSNLKPEETNSTAEEIAEVKDAFVKDWEKFLDDPFWLVKEYKIG